MNCLGHSLSDDMAEQRLRRKLNRQFGKGESLSDLTVWWYNTELHLLDTLSKQPMSFQDLLFRCYCFSVYKGYDFEIFRGLYCHRNAPDLEEPLAADQLFSFSRFVSKRDLGCIHLGTSIHEVLQTLLCACNDSQFCPGNCGCAEHDFECRSSFSSLRSDCTDDDVDGVGGDPPPQKRRRA